LFFKKKDVKVEKEEALTHREAQQVKHRGKTLKRAQKRAGALL
jgi:hypothetical protein